MYNKNFSDRNRSGSNRYSRGPSAGHFGGRSRFGGQGASGGRGFGGGSRRKSFKKSIDPNLYVKKAEEFVKIEEVETVNNFEDFGLNPVLLANIKGKGYIKPTLIQDQVITPVLSGRDVLGIASTGTGKTAAFAIPIINRVINNPNERVIILAPTRELAQQIKQEFRSFTWGLKVYIALAIGGAFIREQIIDIRRGANIIIGTPGRIKDLGQRKVIDFSKMNTVVLDEVDRMLDMGFVDEIRAIMDQIPQERQTLFFSATIDKKVGTLIDTLLRNPVKIAIKSQEASNHVEQNVVRTPRYQKKDTLVQILSDKGQFKKVLIFGATKMIVEEVTTVLVEKGFSADSIHGGKPQHKRQRVLKSFKESQINILVATDVAARGLDVADITHVINFDQPNTYEDYIHRIGRTGRGNAKGFALTFVD